MFCLNKWHTIILFAQGSAVLPGSLCGYLLLVALSKPDHCSEQSPYYQRLCCRGLLWSRPGLMGPRAAYPPWHITTLQKRDQVLYAVQGLAMVQTWCPMRPLSARAWSRRPWHCQDGRRVCAAAASANAGADPLQRPLLGQSGVMG